MAQKFDILSSLAQSNSHVVSPNFPPVCSQMSTPPALLMTYPGPQPSANTNLLPALPTSNLTPDPDPPML